MLEWLKFMGVKISNISNKLLTYNCNNSNQDKDELEYLTPPNNLYVSKYFPISHTSFNIAADELNLNSELSSLNYTKYNPIYTDDNSTITASPLLLLNSSEWGSKSTSLGNDFTGLQIWPIALYQAQFFTAHLHQLLQFNRADSNANNMNYDILELGSGTGLTGLHVAKLIQTYNDKHNIKLDNSYRVILSDFAESALVLCKHNILLNKLQHNTKLIQLTWGNQAKLLLNNNAYKNGFHLIFGSDLFYSTTSCELLLNTIDILLSKEIIWSEKSNENISRMPVFILAYQHRFEPVSKTLIQQSIALNLRCYCVIENNDETNKSNPRFLKFFNIPLRLITDYAQLPTNHCILFFIRRPIK